MYTDICCKLSKCIGQTPCSYEHYLVAATFYQKNNFIFLFSSSVCNLSADGASRDLKIIGLCTFLLVA